MLRAFIIFPFSRRSHQKTAGRNKNQIQLSASAKIKFVSNGQAQPFGGRMLNFTHI
jgi:hypothetical protein|tara:strand:+ start:655 stop:822 length:168 start_codon:yes stop_codon:yes gene_type:complete